MLCISSAFAEEKKAPPVFPSPQFIRKDFLDIRDKKPIHNRIVLIIMRPGFRKDETEAMMEWIPYGAYYAVSPYLPYDQVLFTRLRDNLKGKLLIIIPKNIARTLTEVQIKEILRDFQQPFDGFLIEDIYTPHLLKDETKGHALLIQEARKLKKSIFYAYTSLVEPEVGTKDLFLSDAHITRYHNEQKWEKLSQLLTYEGTIIVTVNCEHAPLKELKSWMQKQVKKFNDVKISDAINIKELPIAHALEDPHNKDTPHNDEES